MSFELFLLSHPLYITSISGKCDTRRERVGDWTCNFADEELLRAFDNFIGMNEIFRTQCAALAIPLVEVDSSNIESIVNEAQNMLTRKV